MSKPWKLLGWWKYTVISFHFHLFIQGCQKKFPRNLNLSRLLFCKKKKSTIKNNDFLNFFPHSSLDSFPFTCTSSLSWHSPARSTLLSSSHYPWSYTCTSESSALSLAQFFLTILAQFPPILFQHQSHSCTSYKWRTHTTLTSNLLFLSWLLANDGVEHRNVLKSNYQLLPPDLSYQHLLVSFEELLSLRLSDHFALVVGCINNNWLKNNDNWNKKESESVYNFWCGHFSAFETEKMPVKKKSFKDDKPHRAQNMLKKKKKKKKKRNLTVTEKKNWLDKDVVFYPSSPINTSQNFDVCLGEPGQTSEGMWNNVSCCSPRFLQIEVHNIYWPWKDLSIEHCFAWKTPVEILVLKLTVCLRLAAVQAVIAWGDSTVTTKYRMSHWQLRRIHTDESFLS